MFGDETLVIPDWIGCGDALRTSVNILGSSRDQTDLLTLRLDLERINGAEVQQDGVSLAYRDVAVALHRGDLAQAPATQALAWGASFAHSDAFGLWKGLLKGREVQAFSAIRFGADITGSLNQIGYGGIGQHFGFGKKVSAVGDQRGDASIGGR